MVRPGLENIPLLSSLPDIPQMYASNAGFSFFVDLILLCALFAALLAPLGAMIFGGGEGAFEKKGTGRKFGAVLGIILGASAAFSLRAAGITLFEYWLTTVAAAALLGAVLFVFLKKLNVNPLIAGAICFILAWMIMDSWFVTSKSATVRSIFGFISLLGPIFFLLFVIWLLRGRLGGGGEAEGRQEGERGPRPPSGRKWWNPFSWFGGPAARPRSLFRPWTWRQGRPEMSRVELAVAQILAYLQQENVEIDAQIQGAVRTLAEYFIERNQWRPRPLTRLLMDRGKSVNDADRIMVAINVILQRFTQAPAQPEGGAPAAQGPAAQAAAAGQALGEAERAAQGAEGAGREVQQGAGAAQQGAAGAAAQAGQAVNAANQGDIEAFCREVEALTVQLQELLKQMNSQKKPIAAIMKLKKDIEVIITKHDTSVRNAQVGFANSVRNIEAQVRAAPTPELIASVQRLKDGLTTLKTTTDELNRLRAQLSNNLGHITNQVEAAYDEVMKAIRDVSKPLSEIAGKKCRQMQGPDAQSLLQDARSVLEFAQSVLVDVEQKCKQIVEYASRNNIVVVTIRNDIKEWHRIFDGTFMTTTSTIWQGLQALEAALRTRPAAPAPVAPAPAPVAAPPPAPPIDTAALEEEINRNAGILQIVLNQIKAAIDQIVFPRPVICNGVNRIRDEQLTAMVSEVFTAAKTAANFNSATAAARADPAIDRLYEYYELIEARLRTQGVPQQERTKLAQLMRKFALFAENRYVIITPFFLRPDDVVKQATFEFVRRPRADITISNDTLTRGVKATLRTKATAAGISLRTLLRARAQP